MGSDVSLQKSVVIDEKATEVNAYWSMYGGECRDGGVTKRLSLFKGIEVDAFWNRKNPLEKAAKNLMLLRHPDILKYVATWTKSGEVTLVTEHTKPLHLCLRQHNAIQICLGLRSILQAVTFLVEKVNMRHLNLCTASIFVTDDGAWKLGGFEFLAAELTQEMLESSRQHRYQKAVDEKNELRTKGVNLEQFAFAVLCRDIFKMHPQAGAPLLSDFQEYCQSQIEAVLPNQRPQLSTILEHAYFNQEFVKVHEFLVSLPLKNSFEKQEFFTDLLRRLRTFDERDVAVHLGDLLLSRLVLLDETAQICVTPFVLDPKCDELVPGLFTTPTFAQFIVPKLKQIFTVHDAQIRMILLEHFHKFMSMFEEQELKAAILPQLLLGIKDTNDHLVSMTLRCLADLVPILGASVVIGKNRSRIFSDGRPQRLAGENNPLTRHWPEARSITPVMEGTADGPELCQQSFADLSTEHLMPVRLAPDGGEDEKGGLIAGVGVEAGDPEDDEAQWSDWDNNEGDEAKEGTIKESSVEPLRSESNGLIIEEKLLTRPQPQNPVVIPDSLTDFDIKVKATSGKGDEEDFFKDMEPVIVAKATELEVFAAMPVELEEKVSRLSMIQVGQVGEAEDSGGGDAGGWGDSDWE